MAQARLMMRKIRQMLRLRWELGLSARLVAQSLSVSHSTVLECEARTGPEYGGNCEATRG